MNHMVCQCYFNIQASLAVWIAIQRFMGDAEGPPAPADKPRVNLLDILG